MDITLILRVGGVGFLVCVLYQVLAKAGREEQALLVSLAGMILILLFLVGQVGELLARVRTVFGL